MAQEAKPAEEAAPKSKKKLIIIIAAVVLLAGGGGAAWFMMGHKADHGKEEAKKEEKHQEQAPVFVTLETFTVNLQPDPNERFLQLDLTVQVASPEVAEQLKAHMPAIRSRLLMLLTSKQASEISTSEGKQLLTEEISLELKKPFNEKGKETEISGVFFTSFVIQ